jgi:hypothetical protein
MISIATASRLARFATSNAEPIREAVHVAALEPETRLKCRMAAGSVQELFGPHGDPAFAEGLAELLALVAESTSAVMCADALWW